MTERTKRNYELAIRMYGGNHAR